jgi:hypothetical protein
MKRDIHRLVFWPEKLKFYAKKIDLVMQKTMSTNAPFEYLNKVVKNKILFQTM